VDDQIQVEVHNPLEDDDASTELSAAHRAAHAACWVDAKEFLLAFGYKEAVYVDEGVLNAEMSSGSISL
jgi:hypothetical protein